MSKMRVGFTSFLQVLEESEENQRKTKEVFAFGLAGQLAEGEGALPSPATAIAERAQPVVQAC